MQYARLKHAVVSVKEVESCAVLDKFIQHCNADNTAFVDKPSYVDLELNTSDVGLQLAWNTRDQKPLKYHLDFEKLARQQRSFPAPKQGAFNQALGKKTKSIIDATGGWAGDAMLMCLQGYQVTLIERLPIMAALIEEAFLRLSKTNWAADNQVLLPRVVWGNAHDVLPTLVDQADCVYLDPMFPARKKKKAASNKQMQLLQWLAGSDGDASELAAIAKRHFPRVAVKRPDYALPLIVSPNDQFSSKLVHYDVYL